MIATLMTSAEVADLARVSPHTVRVWRMRGQGPRFTKTDSGLVRYRRADVEAWLGLADDNEKEERE